MTTRHPIQRLVSGWNNILCNKNCRNQGRVTYARKAKDSLRRIYERNIPQMKGHFNDTNSDGIHMLSFPALVDMLIKDFERLDQARGRNEKTFLTTLSMTNDLSVKMKDNEK